MFYENSFLLDDYPVEFQSDRNINHVTADIINTSCEKSQDECDFCKKTEGVCWQQCNRAKYCKFKKQQSSFAHDPPYFDDHPYSQGLSGLPMIQKELARRYAQSQMITPRVCGPAMYTEYINQYNNYTECQRCKKENTCWSQERQKCVNCRNNQQSCGKQFGCLTSSNSGTGVYPLLLDNDSYGPPIDPMYTRCKKCWK